MLAAAVHIVIRFFYDFFNVCLFLRERERERERETESELGEGQRERET